MITDITPSGYVVLYAKVVDDKESGILMIGIFFGGVCETKEEADVLATACVSDTQGGMIIPRVAPVDADLMNVVRSMESQFDTMADHMYDNEATMNRQKKR